MKQNVRFFSMLILGMAWMMQTYAQVEVSTGGSPTVYSTLKEAFDAINLGAHTV